MESGGDVAQLETGHISAVVAFLLGGTAAALAVLLGERFRWRRRVARAKAARRERRQWWGTLALRSLNAELFIQVV